VQVEVGSNQGLDLGDAIQLLNSGYLPDAAHNGNIRQNASV
jgi:hypothetical protein